MFGCKETCCRVCLRNDANHSLLCDKCRENRTYLELFFECTKISAQPDDQLCSGCAKELISFYEYVCKARESDVTLRRLRSVNISEQRQTDVYEDEAACITSEGEKKCPLEKDGTTVLVDPLDIDDYEFIKEEALSSLATENDEARSLLTEANLDLLGNEESVVLDSKDDGCETMETGILTEVEMVHIVNEKCDKQKTAKDGHLKPPAVTCNVCGKILSSKKTLRRHMLIHTDNRVKPPTVICNICGKVLSAKKNLPRHMLVHLNESNKSQRTDNETKGDPSMETCNVCGKMLRTKKTLQQHMLIHSGHKDFLCTMCPKTFINKHKLRIHLRCHTGERPYECKLCQMRFTHITTLECHQRRHTGERPYSCDICGRHFIQQSNLRSHKILVHEEKTISCPHCDNKFARPIDLNNHLRKVRGERPFACDFCSNRYFHRGSLNNHLKTSHLDQIDTLLPY